MEKQTEMEAGESVEN